MFNDPERTLNIGSFTAFVFVCLNVRCQRPTHSPEPLTAEPAERLARNSAQDQSVEGRGQTAVLPGAHHAIERFFRNQRDSPSGVLGPGGEGWCANPPLPSIPTRLTSPIGGAVQAASGL